MVNCILCTAEVLGKVAMKVCYGQAGSFWVDQEVEANLEEWIMCEIQCTFQIQSHSVWSMLPAYCFRIEL